MEVTPAQRDDVIRRLHLAAADGRLQWLSLIVFVFGVRELVAILLLLLQQSILTRIS